MIADVKDEVEKFFLILLGGIFGGGILFLFFKYAPAWFLTLSFPIVTLIAVLAYWEKRVANEVPDEEWITDWKYASPEE